MSTLGVMRYNCDYLAVINVPKYPEVRNEQIIRNDLAASLARPLVGPNDATYSELVLDTTGSLAMVL